MNKLQTEIRNAVQIFSEDICDNYCKYRDTADEDNICDAIREKGYCPLEALNFDIRKRRSYEEAKTDNPVMLLVVVIEVFVMLFKTVSFTV